MDVSRILSTCVPVAPAKHASTSLTTADQLLQRARDRHGYEVAPELSVLFPRGCIEPGAVYHCGGPGALSVVCALVGTATRDNKWTAFVNMSFLNMDAVADYGVALQRVVSVQCPAFLSAEKHAQVLGSLVEGCDLVVTSDPQCSPSGARSVVARAKRNRTSVFIVGKHCFSVDTVVSTRVHKWEFQDRLSSRSLAIDVHHQRTQQKMSVCVELPDAAGAVSVIV